MSNQVNDAREKAYAFDTLFTCYLVFPVWCVILMVKPGSLARLAERMALMYARTEIQARVCAWWGGLSLQEQPAAPDEYIETNGHRPSSELTKSGARRVRAGFLDLLMEHTSAVRRLGRLGR